MYGTICSRSKISKTNGDAKAVPQLIEWGKGSDMLMIGGNYLITSMPIETVADDVYPFTGIISQCDLILFSVDQACNTATR